MTVDSVGLAEIQQTLSEMQSASVATGASISTGDGAFATSLAQATSDLSATNGLSDVGGNTLFSEALDGGGGSFGTADGLSSGGGSDGEFNLVAMLLSTQDGAGASGVSGTDALSGADGATGQDVVNEASQFEGTPYVWGGRRRRASTARASPSTSSDSSVFSCHAPVRSRRLSAPLWTAWPTPSRVIFFFLPVPTDRPAPPAMSPSTSGTGR